MTVLQALLAMSQLLAYLVFFGEFRIAQARAVNDTDANSFAHAAKPRIIGGKDAIPGSYPFFVSILAGASSHSCGGTLVAPDVVLTAAHCVGLAKAQVGRSVRSDPNDHYEEFKLIQEVRHPIYDNQAYKLDFMLMKMDGLSTAPVIRMNDNEELPPMGVPDGVKAIGFGVTEFYYDGSHGGAATILQEVDMEAITNEQCMASKDPDNEKLAYANGYDGLITADMICATGDGKDTCLGEFYGSKRRK